MSHVNVALSLVIYLLAGKSKNMQVKLTHQVHTFTNSSIVVNFTFQLYQTGWCGLMACPGFIPASSLGDKTINMLGSVCQSIYNKKNKQTNKKIRPHLYGARFPRMRIINTTVKVWAGNSKQRALQSESVEFTFTGLDTNHSLQPYSYKFFVFFFKTAASMLLPTFTRTFTL